MKKTLFTVLAIVMAVAMMGSAFAYFTDVRVSNNNVIAAGTLQMQIANEGGSFGAGPVAGGFSSPANLAPGASFTTKLVYLQNTGTIPIKWIFARFTNLVDSVGGMSDKIILTAVDESNNNGATFVHTDFPAATANAYKDFWYSQGASFFTDNGKITLYDLYLARNYGSGDKVTSLLLLNNGFSNPALPAGATAAFKFTFQLDPTVTNVYQGASSTFDVFFIGTQDDQSGYPDTVLANYITQPLGN